MSIIQKRADQLIAPARLISKQIRDYQEDCKNKGIKFYQLLKIKKLTLLIAKTV
jgi:predicted peroxiredoxin